MQPIGRDPMPPEGPHLDPRRIPSRVGVVEAVKLPDPESPFSLIRSAGVGLDAHGLDLG